MPKEGNALPYDKIVHILKHGVYCSVTSAVFEQVSIL